MFDANSQCHTAAQLFVYFTRIILLLFQGSQHQQQQILFGSSKHDCSWTRSEYIQVFIWVVYIASY